MEDIVPIRLAVTTKISKKLLAENEQSHAREDWGERQKACIINDPWKQIIGRHERKGRREHTLRNILKLKTGLSCVTDTRRENQSSYAMIEIAPRRHGKGTTGCIKHTNCIALWEEPDALCIMYEPGTRKLILTQINWKEESSIWHIYSVLQPKNNIAEDDVTNKKSTQSKICYIWKQQS